MTKKFIILLVSFFSVFGLIFVLQSLNKKNIYRKKINTRIVDVENHYNKLLYFYYDNGRFFSSLDIKDTLIIGDSISKSANTFTFFVFRQNEDSSYSFYKQLKFY